MEEQEQPAPSSGSLKISLKLAGIRKEADKPGEPAAAAPQEENPNNADQPGSSTDRQMPFYCFSERLPSPSKLSGSTDLLAQFNLSSAYQKYCTPGKIKPDFASYLPNLSDTENLCSNISSSTLLRTLIEKPPITGKMIVLPSDMKGFQLTPGSVTDAYRLFDTRDVLKLIGDASSGSQDTYDEFGKNFNDPESVKEAHRRTNKRVLEDPEVLDERKIRKHKKKEKKSKKEKKERREAEEEKSGASFY